MPPWQLEFSHDAAKALLRMPRDEAKRIRSRLDELARDPLHAPNVKKLVGVHGYRLRVGDWRVLYRLIEDRCVVDVIRIATRGQAYR